MPTLGDLKQTIADDLTRDDLAPDGEDAATTFKAIKAAVRQYSGRNWWFLTTTQTLPAVPGQNFITRPATISRIDRVSIPALGYDIGKEDLALLERLDEPAIVIGQPDLYAEAEAGTQLRLWPMPNATYLIKIVGTRFIPEMAADGDSNVWTNEAYDLIAASAKRRLCRFPLRDPNGVVLAADEEAEALRVLDEINIDRLDGPVCAGW
jgi:hypothetical protein